MPVSCESSCRAVMTISQSDIPAASTGLVHTLMGQVEEEERLIEALLQAARDENAATTLVIARQIMSLRLPHGEELRTTSA